MAGADTYVQIQPDSTGKKVRTIEVTVVQPDGSTATVELQVVAIADNSGNIINNFIDYNWQSEMLAETKRIRLGIQRLLDAFGHYDALDHREAE